MTRTEITWLLIGLYFVLAISAFAIGHATARDEHVAAAAPHQDSAALVQQMRVAVSKAVQVGWRCRNEGKTEAECSRFLERLAEDKSP